MRSLKTCIVSIVAVASATLSACSNSGIPWKDGPGWRLSGSPTSIPPEKVYPAPAQPLQAPQAAGQARVYNAPAIRSAQLPTVAVPAGARTVVVGPGDTLTEIAIRHRTSISALMAANRLADPRVEPGQRLILPPR